MNLNVTVLAQLAPGATSETVLYTVPTTNRSFINGLTVCNRAASAQSFRVSVSLLGAATATKDYIYFDLPIVANDTFMATLEFTLGARGVIRVYASSADLSFTLYGIP